MDAFVVVSISVWTCCIIATWGLLQPIVHDRQAHPHRTTTLSLEIKKLLLS